MERASDHSEGIFDIELPTQPYPGLRSFEKHEWPIFFGREIVTGEIVDRLIDKQFLALHGDSGCGKSSLVRAGVLPRLERDHARGGSTWRTVSMLPRNAPLRNFAGALAILDEASLDPNHAIELRRILNLGSKAAKIFSDRLRRNELDHICVLVDQFEEVFNFGAKGGASEVQQFVDVLVGFQQERPPGMHLILTLRSEFLGSCAHYRGLAEIINETQFLLPRMQPAAMMRAIREPARLYHGTVENELAEEIIADSERSQDQLPLMQHAIRLLRKRAIETDAKSDDTPSWTLDVQEYRDSGGVAKLLSDHADRAIEEIALHSRDAERTRRLIQRTFKALTEINAEGHVIRRPQSIRELTSVSGAENSEETLAIVEPLCADGVSFLKVFGNAPYNDNELVDITHEALIRTWRSLQAWTVEEAEDGAKYLRLLNLAHDNRRDPSIILGLREARDRDKWWAKLQPNQAWADRYSFQHKDIGLDKVRALLDRSLDSQAQEFAFWREHIEIARKLWNDGEQPDALLQGYGLTQAEYWLGQRSGEITEADRAFIAKSTAERDRRDAEVKERERQQREAELEAERMRTAVAQLAANAAEERVNASRLVMRRTIVGLAVALVLAIFSAGMGSYAYLQRQQALAQRQEAITQGQEAEQQMRVAQDAEKEAEKQRGIALAAQAKAEQAQKEEEQARRLAEEEKSRAETNLTQLLALAESNRTSKAQTDSAASYVSALGATPQTLDQTVKALKAEASPLKIAFLGQVVGQLSSIASKEQIQSGMETLIRGIDRAQNDSEADAIGQSISSLAAKLTNSQAQDEANALLQLKSQGLSSRQTRAVVQVLGAIAPKVNQRTAEDIRGVLIRVLSEGGDPELVSAAALALSTFRWTGSSADPVLDSVLVGLTLTSDPIQLGNIASLLVAMSPALSRGAAEKALSHLRTMAPQTIESVKPAIAALTTRLQQDSQPAVSLLQRMSGNRWCVSSKTYSLQLLTGSIIWRDNAGSVDVESIVSNGTTDARTVTQKSSHPEGKSEEVGTSWNYRLASPDKIYVNSSNKDPSKNKSFSLSRC